MPFSLQSGGKSDTPKSIDSVRGRFHTRYFGESAWPPKSPWIPLWSENWKYLRSHRTTTWMVQKFDEMSSFNFAMVVGRIGIADALARADAREIAHLLYAWLMQL